MAKRIFVAVPQYKPLTEEQVTKLLPDLGMEKWEPNFKGFHPRFDLAMTRLANSKHKVCLSVITGDSELYRCRSQHLGVLKQYIDRGDWYDYYLCVDDDIEFTPEGIDQLIEDDKDMICALYPFKCQEGHKAAYPVAKLFNKWGTEDADVFKVRWMNGGFILIKTEALLKMIEAYPEQRYSWNSQSEIPIEQSWALWQPFVHQVNGRRVLLSEDYAFSQRANDIGYDCWADKRVRLIHWDGAQGYVLKPKGVTQWQM